jgi:hypothetical protein
MGSKIVRGLAALLMLIAAGGCRHKSQVGGAVPPAPAPSADTAAARAASQPAATRPSSTQAVGGTFDGTKWGIRLDYPVGWVVKPNQDYVLLLIPTGAAGEERSLSLDVPDLPPHVPGMIPLTLVKNGYLDDLKKTHGSLQTREEAVSISGARATRVTSTWQQNGKMFCEIAVIMTHGDRVFIVRANCDAAGQETMRGPLESIIHSIRWKK